MATNKIVKFAEGNVDNTFTDNELLEKDLLDGIKFGSIAYSDILNAILRQTTAITSIIGELMTNQLGKDITSNVNLNDLSETLKKLSISTQTIINAKAGITKIWSGTTTEYNGLTKDPNTIYFIID